MTSTLTKFLRFHWLSSSLAGLMGVLVLPSAALAYDGWSIGRITAIRYQAQRLLIWQENATNPGNCTTTNYLILNTSTAGFDQMSAALLTAHSTGGRVDLALTGCTDGRPNITEVWLK